MKRSVVEIYEDSAVASKAAAELEEKGIKASVDSFESSILPKFVVSISVEASKYSAAREVLALGSWIVENDGKKILCPRCQSSSVSFSRSKFAMALLLLLFGALTRHYTFPRKEWRCNACGESWEYGRVPQF